MVKPLKTVNCHISMFNHVVMTHLNLIERSYLKQEAAVNAGRNCGAHSQVVVFLTTQLLLCDVQ